MTPYLKPGFVRTWYTHYCDTWIPLLCVGTDDKGRLLGIAPLALHNGHITGAGAHQAEYQGWLSLQQDAETFLMGMLRSLAERYPSAHLRIRYLLPGPLAVVQRLAARDARLMISVYQRPLMNLDADIIKAALKKKNTRSKMNRLKRSGDLYFERLSGFPEFERQLDSVITLYDFRQAAANDSAPFLEDHRKRQFHLDWFRLAPEDFYVTRMGIGERTIAAFVGIRADKVVHNAIIAYAPDVSRHSPGKLHLYQTGMAMLESGIDSLDLTSGGDPWKERFANAHDEVGELNFYVSGSARLQARLKTSMQPVARKLLGSVSIRPEQLRAWSGKLRRLNGKQLVTRCTALLPATTEYRIYRMRLPAGLERAGVAPQVNNYDDLVRFVPHEVWQTRYQVLSSALERIERGQRAYSHRSGERLLHVGWLLPRQEEAWFTEVGYRYTYPEPGAVLYDFYTAPEARGQGLYQHTLRHMLADLSEMPAAGIAYISVLADNGASRHVIEKLGFEYVESIFERRLPGRRSHYLAQHS